LSRNEPLVGLDIGTSMTRCIVAEESEFGELVITGIGEAPSSGIQKGVVVDIEAARQSVESAIKRASQQSGKEIAHVVVAVTGQNIASLNSKGVTAITHPDHEIRQTDVDRALQQSRVIVVPPDRAIIHSIPRSFTVDGQSGIQQPVGMSGARLEVETHIVTGAQTFLQNLEKCVTRSGVAIEEMVLASIATSEAVLTPAERAQGVALVDIGEGATDIAIYTDGHISYSATLAVGGKHITTDIAQLLKVTLEEAERLKLNGGSAWPDGVGENETVPVLQIGRSEPRKLRRRALCEIIEARLQELFQLIESEIAKSGCAKELAAGIILTGGASKLVGITQCANDCLGMPVRVGQPARAGGLGESIQSPQYSTAAGLVKHSLSKRAWMRKSTAVAPGDQVGKAVKWLKDRFGVR
jgi:cell division protein FtsA